MLARYNNVFIGNDQVQHEIENIDYFKHELAKNVENILKSDVHVIEKNLEKKL